MNTARTITDEGSKVWNALEDIAEIGATYLKKEYRAQTDRFEKVGMALGRYSPTQIAQLAYSAWEDMNAHDYCAVLNWMTNLYGKRHIQDIERLKRQIEREYEVTTDYNEETHDWNRKTIRVRLVVEDVEA